MNNPSIYLRIKEKGPIMLMAISTLYTNNIEKMHQFNGEK